MSIFSHLFQRRRFLATTAIAIVVAITISLLPVPLRAATPSNSAIYYGGDILTMVGNKPQYVEAIAVKDGRIAYVGTKAGAMKLKGANTSLIDLKGQTLMPGFQDTHGHVLLKASNLSKLDMSPAKDIPDVIARLKAYIAEKQPKPGEWVQVYLVPGPQILGRLITAEDLDQVSTEIPIFAQEASGHIATLNTAGLKKLGFTADTPDPQGGTIRRKQGSKEPNGIIDEAAVIQTLGNFPPLPPELAEKYLRQTIALWTKYGYTTARDQLTGLSSTDMIMARIGATKGLPIDLILYPDATRADKILAENADLQRGYVNRVRIGGIKIMMDGVPNSYTAYMRQPYSNPPADKPKDWRGFPNVPTADVMKYVDQYYNTPIQINAHAMGDAAVANFLSAIEAAEKKYGKQDRRPIAHHIGVAQPDLIPRFAKTGTIATFNSASISGLGKTAAPIFGERSRYVMPARSLLNSGARVTIATDCPSGPTEPAIMRDVFGIVTRKAFTSDFVLAPEERISMYEAFVGVTRDGAYANFEETIKGTLEAGKLADLVILDQNPLKIAPTKVLEVKVMETIKDGKTVYKNDGKTAAQPSFSVAESDYLKDFMGHSHPF